jgi:hypothetical protein
VIAVAPLDRPGEVETARFRVNRFGGQLDARPDGILLVTLPQGQSVVRAASLALALVEAHPRARIGLATARTEMVAVDGATALLKRKHARGARIDEATAHLLDPSFEVRIAGPECVLVARRGPAERADVSGDGVDSALLALTRSGLRFLRRETEAYLAWHLEKAIPFTLVVSMPELASGLHRRVLRVHMAPELVRVAREAGPPADLFSFGIIAQELLSTKLPYAVPPVLERLSGRVPPPPVPLAQSSPEVPAQLCALVDGCLALAPEARPTAEVVVAVLDIS